MQKMRRRESVRISPSGWPGLHTGSLPLGQAARPTAASRAESPRGSVLGPSLPAPWWMKSQPRRHPGTWPHQLEKSQGTSGKFLSHKAMSLGLHIPIS